MSCTVTECPLTPLNKLPSYPIIRGTKNVPLAEAKTVVGNCPDTSPIKVHATSYITQRSTTTLNSNINPTP